VADFSKKLLEINNMDIKISCLVLAAGLSSRMPIGNKLLLKVKSLTIIEKTIKNLYKSNIDSFFIILGHQSNLFSKVLKNFKIPLIINDSYQEGISSSIKKGISLIDHKSNGVMICLADMPKITSKTYNILIDEFKKFYNSATPLIILPEYNGQTGNPVILSKHFFSELKKISGDVGAKYLIKKNKKYIKKVDISEKYILEDIDDLEKYRELIKNEK
tara:strand:- start:293 stop:943 length:651 start_codon:yes stop_codon:yes gene_type:complete